MIQAKLQLTDARAGQGRSKSRLDTDTGYGTVSVDCHSDDEGHEAGGGGRLRVLNNAVFELCGCIGRGEGSAAGRQESGRGPPHGDAETGLRGKQTTTEHADHRGFSSSSRASRVSALMLVSFRGIPDTPKTRNPNTVTPKVPNPKT